MTYAYLRVSTDNQYLENQEYEVTEFCRKRDIIIDKFVREKKSGTVSYKDRSLGKLLKKLRKGDILVCSEISRLGRSMYMIMEILNILMNKGVSFFTVKEGFSMSDSIGSKVISFAFSLSAEIERNLISQRTKEALAARKAAGMKLGRPVGAKNKAYKLDKYSRTIIDGRKAGMSYYKLGKICGNVGLNNVKNWCLRNGVA